LGGLLVQLQIFIASKLVRHGAKSKNPVPADREDHDHLRLLRKCLFRSAKDESLWRLFMISLKGFLNGRRFPVQGVGDP
jgi:hypothetical protein